MAEALTPLVPVSTSGAPAPAPPSAPRPPPPVPAPRATAPGPSPQTSIPPAAPKTAAPPSQLESLVPLSEVAAPEAAATSNDLLFLGTGLLVTLLALALTTTAFSLLWIHVGTDGLNQNHLSDTEKARADAGEWHADTVEPVDPNAPIVFSGEVQFLGTVRFASAEALLNASLSKELVVDTVVADEVYVPNPKQPNATVLITTLYYSSIQECSDESTAAIEQQLADLTVTMDQYDFVVMQHGQQVAVFQSAFAAHNATYLSNEMRIASFNVTCNSSVVAAYISQFNATNARLVALVAADQINWNTYNSLSLRLANQSALAMSLSGANCSALLALEMDVATLQTDYLAALALLNAATVDCTACAAIVANQTALVASLSATEQALLANVSALLSQALQLQSDTSALDASVASSLTSAQLLNATLVDLVANFTALNSSLAADKANATVLEGLAQALSASLTALDSDVLALNISATSALLTVQNASAVCAGVNSTQALALLADMNALIANISNVLLQVDAMNTALSTGASDIAALEARMTLVEGNLTVIAGDVAANQALFASLNATYVSLLASYNSELARYTLLEGLLTNYTARYNALLAQFTALQANVSAVQATQSSNNATIVDHEARISALEAVNCTSGTNTTTVVQGTATQGFAKFNMIANEDMSAGTPVTIRPGFAQVSPARGVRLQSHSSLMGAPSITGQLPFNSKMALDRSDYIYAISSAKRIMLSQSETTVTTAYWPSGFILNIDNTNPRNCVVAKLAGGLQYPMWTAYIAGSAHQIVCDDILVDRRREWIYVGIRWRSDINFLATWYTSESSIELYDSGAFSYSYRSFDVLTVNDRRHAHYAIATISKGGRWVGFEEIRALVPTFGSPGYGIGHIQMFGVSAQGQIVGSVQISKVPGDPPQTLNFGGQLNYTLSVDNEALTVYFEYNVITGLFGYVRNLFGTQTPTTRASWGDMNLPGNVYISYVVDLGAAGTNETIAMYGGGAPVTLTGADIIGTADDGYAHFVARLHRNTGMPMWVGAFTHGASSGTTVSTNINLGQINVMNQAVCVLLVDAVPFIGYSKIPEHLIGVIVPGGATADQMLCVNKNNGEADTLIDLSYPKNSTLPTTSATEFDRWSTVTTFYDTRRDELHVLAQTDPTATAMTIMGEAYTLQGPPTTTTHLAAVHLYIRSRLLGPNNLGYTPTFGSNPKPESLVIGSVTELKWEIKQVSLTPDEGPILFYAMAVDGQSRVNVMFGGGRDIDSIISFSAGASGLAHTFSDTSATPSSGGFMNTFVLAFTMEEFWPLGLLEADVLQGEIASVVLHGRVVIPGFFANATDTGRIFDVAFPNLMSRTESAGDAQMGVKTDVPDEFIVDIHTVALVGTVQ